MLTISALNHQVLDFYSQSSPATTSSSTKTTESTAAATAKSSDPSKRPAATDGMCYYGNQQLLPAVVVKVFIATILFLIWYEKGIRGESKQLYKERNQALTVVC